MQVHYLVFFGFITLFIPSSINSLTNILKIKNNISKKDTSKTKFFMRHYPKEFTIKVNGKTVPSHEATEITIPDKKFNIQYSYVWQAPWGNITGTKQVNFQLIDTDTKEIELDFSSWDDEYRIKATGAKPTGVKVIESSGSREKPKKKKVKRKKHVFNTANKSLIPSIPYNSNKPLA